MTRAFPRLAFQIWVVLFVVFFGAEVVHLEPTLRIITQLAFGVPLVIGAARLLRGPADPLDWAVIGLLGVFALVCFMSWDRTESLGTLALATAFSAWFLLMRRATDTRQAIVVAVATGLAMTLAFNALLLVKEKLDWYAAVGGAPFEGVMTFPWESVNALPLLVLAAIPFVAWVGRPWLRRLLALTVGISALVVVPISLGRAGWFGLAAAGVIILVLHPIPTRAVARLSHTQRLIGGAGLALAVGAAIVVIGPRLVRAIGESGRLLLWDQGLHIFAANPLTGVGPGLYSWARLDYPPAQADLLELRLVHNVPIETLIDGGLLLAIGIFAIGVAYARALQRALAWRTEKVAFATLGGFLATFTLDDISYLPALTAMVVTIAAFAVPVRSPAPEQRRKRRLAVLPVLLGAAALAALPSVIAVDQARAHAQTGRDAMVAGDLGEAVTQFTQAAALHPESGGYWLGLGMAQAYSGRGSEAIQAYRRATEVAPGDPRGYAALAELDPAADPVALLRAAADRSLGDPQFAVRLGAKLARDGDSGGAVHAWGRAVALQPQLLRLLPYEGTDVSIDDVARAARLIIEGEPRPGPHDNLVVLWDVELATGQVPEDADDAWRAVDAARRGDLARGKQLAESAVRKAPYEAHGYQALAAVAAFACDSAAEESALRLERLALNAYAPADPDPRLRREFIYREASLGASQPPGIGLGIEVERWPWPLIDRPYGCDT